MKSVKKYLSGLLIVGILLSVMAGCQADESKSGSVDNSEGGNKQESQLEEYTYKVVELQRGDVISAEVSEDNSKITIKCVCPKCNKELPASTKEFSVKDLVFEEWEDVFDDICNIAKLSDTAICEHGCTEDEKPVKYVWLVRAEKKKAVDTSTTKKYKYKILLNECYVSGLELNGKRIDAISAKLSEDNTKVLVEYTAVRCSCFRRNPEYDRVISIDDLEFVVCDKTYVSTHNENGYKMTLDSRYYGYDIAGHWDRGYCGNGCMVPINYNGDLDLAYDDWGIFVIRKEI